MAVREWSSAWQWQNSGERVVGGGVLVAHAVCHWISFGKGVRTISPFSSLPRAILPTRNFGKKIKTEKIGNGRFVPF